MSVSDGYFLRHYWLSKQIKQLTAKTTTTTKKMMTAAQMPLRY